MMELDYWEIVEKLEEAKTETDIMYWSRLLEECIEEEDEYAN